ncbi:uncharacterized protein LOC117531348 isoform X1 [Thalassophryne amazonica]|uniref:uncharacterized protein LOC117531348 isoform X1 n=1 Tax=Thalassophryne amazonica TaxID=390379 RepID=UPI0014715149|nr:uncharacterized protein LOC117531348 isoform X1 [Thalassophryne amazonica]
MFESDITAACSTAPRHITISDAAWCASGKEPAAPAKPKTPGPRPRSTPMQAPSRAPPKSAPRTTHVASTRSQSRPPHARLPNVSGPRPRLFSAFLLFQLLDSPARLCHRRPCASHLQLLQSPRQRHQRRFQPARSPCTLHQRLERSPHLWHLPPNQSLCASLQRLLQTPRQLHQRLLQSPCQLHQRRFQPARSPCALHQRLERSPHLRHLPPNQSLCASLSSGCSRLHASCTSGCSSLHASGTCDASSQPGLHAQCAIDWSNLRTCGTSDCSGLHAHGCIGLCAHRASTCSSARRTTTSLKARRCVVRTHAVGTFPSCASSSCSSFTAGTEDDDRGRKPGDVVPIWGFNSRTISTSHIFIMGASWIYNTGGGMSVSLCLSQCKCVCVCVCVCACALLFVSLYW